VHDLSGKTILLTGASKGIGAATAEALARAGARLIAHYGSDRDGAVAATAGAAPDRLKLVQADLSQPGAAAELWREAVGWTGEIDVLVNNAAVMPSVPFDAGDEAWDDAWEQSWQVNVKAPADLMRAAVPHFVARGSGTLITLSSWVAQRGSANRGLLAYSASKGAVKALTQTVARGYAADGVLAYLIAPGVVGTEMSVRAAGGPEGVEALTAGLAMREWVPPQEIGDLVTYLATGTCRHLSGATLDVNGASYVR